MKNLSKKFLSVLSLMLIGSAIAFQVNATCGYVLDGTPGTCTFDTSGHYCDIEVVPYESCSK